MGASVSSAQTETVCFGVNLAGAEFGSNFPGTYGSDYVYPSTKILDYYASKGLRLIRLPIKWERVQPNLGTELNQKELERIEGVINNAKARDLLVIIDLHNYGRRSIDGTTHIIGSPEVSLTHIKDFWFRLADVLKNHSNIWGYGLMNEPHSMLPSPSWFTISQGIIDAIRVTDTSTNIIVGGDSWSSAEKWMKYSDNLKNLTDNSNKLIFEAHVYFDSDASGRYAKTYDKDGVNPYTGVERVTPFVNWLKANNFRGFIGEYGVPRNDVRWLTVLDNFLSYIKSNNINGTYWAGGAWWGDYTLSIEPKNSIDAPQMSIVQNYLSFVTTNINEVGSTSGNLSSSKYKVYPTIIVDHILIERSSGFYNPVSKYVIYDLFGKQVMTGALADEITKIDFNKYNPGIYLLQIEEDEMQIFKLLKQ